MYLKVNNIKVPIKIKTTFKDKMKSFRFKFDEVKYALCFPNKRKINTYFYCLKFDIIMTDKDNVILNIFPNAPTESRFRGKRKVYYTKMMESFMKYFEVFKAGNYPQGKFTKEEVQELAKNYDPSFCEAPITLYHEQKGPAYGWVDKLK